MFDTIALSVLGLSILYSVWKGMLREVFSLLGLVAAYLVASHYYVPLAEKIAGFIPGEALGLIVSFILLFLFSLFLIAFVGRLAKKFLHISTTFSGWDRILGGVFGMVKGVLILIVFMLPLQWFDETYARLTEDSVVAPYLEDWVDDLRENIGPEFTRTLPGALKGLRKQASDLDGMKEQLTEQKDQLEEKISSLSENRLPPQEYYTDKDQEELDSILNRIEEEYKNQTN